MINAEELWSDAIRKARNKELPRMLVSNSKEVNRLHEYMVQDGDGLYIRYRVYGCTKKCYEDARNYARFMNYTFIGQVR